MSDEGAGLVLDELHAAAVQLEARALWLEESLSDAMLPGPLKDTLRDMRRDGKAMTGAIMLLVRAEGRL